MVLVVMTLFVASCMLAIAQERPKPTGESETEEREPPFSFSLSPEYTQGKFGTGHTTRILYVPLKSEWRPTDSLELSLTVPYLWERGRDIRALIGGRVIISHRSREAFTRTGRVTTEDGLGDVLAELDYSVLEDKAFLPDITPFVEIKFPTSDSSRGLGTGKFDETIGTYLTKKLTERWTAYLDLSYIFVGSPRGLRLADVFTWSPGLSYGVTPALKLSGYVDGATELTKHDQMPIALRAVGEYTLSKHLVLKGSATAGLTHQAPDFGVLTELKIRF